MGGCEASAAWWVIIGCCKPSAMAMHTPASRAGAPPEQGASPLQSELAFVGLLPPFQREISSLSPFQIDKLARGIR